MNRTVLTIATLAGIAAVYHGALGRGHLAEIAAQKRRFGDAYDRYESADREAERTVELRDCALELERWRDQLLKHAAADAAAAPLPATSTAFAAEGLTIERAELLPGDATLSLPHDRLRVVVAGTFADMFRAIAKLENGSPPARVTELAIRGRPGTSTLSADLTIVRTGGAGR